LEGEFFVGTEKLKKICMALIEKKKLKSLVIPYFKSRKEESKFSGHFSSFCY
jgi:hypothetical protein